MALLLFSAIPTGAFGLGAPTGDVGLRGASDSGLSPLVLPTESVAIQNHTVGNLSNFWGVGVTPSVTLATASDEIQGTPVNWAVWPAGKIADTYNMTTGQVWTDGYPMVQPANESDFVSWCKSTSCHAIFTVPGEIDSPSTGAYEVAYTEQVLNFHPAYWEVGNEPYGWQHFGKPWSQWKATDNISIGPTGYAQVVQSYITAMRAVDPTIQFVGLPGVGAGTKPDGPWLNATVSLNGPNLSAVAIHDYPAERGPTGGTLAQFFASLLSPRSNMVTRISTDEKYVKAACPTCRPLSFFVDEFGAGTGQSGPWQPFMDTYPQVPFVSAELIQMMETNVSNADLFSLRSGYNGSLFNANGLPLPVDSLYTQIVPQIDPTPLATTVSGSVSGVFAAASTSLKSNPLTLFAVNTNTTQSVELNATGTLFPTDGSYSVWRANNSTTSSNGSFTHTFGTQSAPSWLLPPLGVILVSVCRSNVSGAFGSSVYGVSFCESGLPAGTPWSVTLGSTTTTSSNEIISFTEPNGTLSYQLGAVPGWRTPVVSGSVTVRGGPAEVQVPWAAVAFPVDFTENGLPPGTMWSVTVAGNRSTSTTDVIATSEPNGTYNYTVGGIAGWSTLLYRGTVTVDVIPVQVVVNWTRVTYLITFHQSGLPGGTLWSVNLSGTELNSTTSTIKVDEPNGTYSYSVGPVSGYVPDTYSGSVTVKATTPFVPISWATSPSTIWFNETGLPAGTNWSVDLNGTVQAGDASSYSFYEPNGGYAYSFASAGWAPNSYRGTVTVTGSPITVVVSWSRVLYNVTFDSTGLPFRTNWSVTLNGSTVTSPASVISFTEPNATALPYRIFGAVGYVTTWLGSVTVNGSAVAVPVVWSPYYSTVTFNETGLPTSGSNWYMNVSGRAAELIWTSLGNWTPTFPNGTYTYNDSTSWGGYGPTTTHGNFTVAGVPLVVVVAFVRVYAVHFNETGLPAGTEWSVTVNGTTASSTTSEVRMYEPRGDYPYFVDPLVGYLPTPANGSVDVNGEVEVDIAWAPPPPPGFNVTFEEDGLPTGSSWSVSIDGSTTFSVGENLSFYLPNDTYPFQIGVVSGWSPSPKNGSIQVDGVPLFVTIQWTHTGILAYAVNFTESGLPAGTSWSVTLNRSTQRSTEATISFLETNGTYAYQVSGVTGWKTSLVGGNVTVQGGPKQVEVTFARVTYSVTFIEVGLPGGTAWAVTLGGSPQTSEINGITFTETAGSYSYALGAVAGWATTNYSGTVVVSGPTTLTIAWTLRLYVVTVTETGLVSGSTWAVTLGSATHTGTESAMVFTEGNGSYAYTIQVPAGYSVDPGTGNVAVAGSAVTLSVTISESTVHSASHLVEYETAALVGAVVIVAAVGVLWVLSRKKSGEAPPPGTV
jgi:hypothetical protein